MYKKIVQICSAILLFVSAGVQAGGSPDLLYPRCVDESDRHEMRELSNECDNDAMEDYHVGIFRPANPSDDLSGFEVPDCENSNPGYGPGYGGYGPGYGGYDPGYGYGRDYGRGYGRGYDDGYGDTPWGAGSSLYVCLGAPSIN